MAGKPTFYEIFKQRGISRRDFLGFCALTTTYLGLGPEGTGTIVHAVETKPRIPVLWLHSL